MSDMQPKNLRSKVAKFLRFLSKRLFRFLAECLLFLTALWCFSALVFCAGNNASTGWGAALVFAGLALTVRTFTPTRRGMFLQIVLFLPVMVWFYRLEPVPGTVYQTPWAKSAGVQFFGDRIAVRNVRDFHYRTETDYDVRYRSEIFDPREAQDLYLAVSHWDGQEKIAHTMLSFGFRDGRHIVLSVETGVPVGMEQNALAGLFKQFRLAMVGGTESDILQLRTKFRRETLYFYPTSVSPEDVGTLFRVLMHTTAERERRPVFYNTLVRNCTTELARPALPFLFGGGLDLRLLLNGFFDELIEDSGLLKLRGSLQREKNRYRIPEFLPGGDEGYSADIRRFER